MAAKESPRPVIGINTDYFLAGKTYSAHARVNAGYFDAVYAAGGLPIILPPIIRLLTTQHKLPRFFCAFQLNYLCTL